jgi:hypothetical protein
MATPSFAPILKSGRRMTLAQIDSLVSARLGPTRGLGNAQPACFNRQVAIFLANRVRRWSTAVIGRLYNGLDHSTVCDGIQRIEALRESCYVLLLRVGSLPLKSCERLTPGSLR